jgi:hypothetical protein
VLERGLPLVCEEVPGLRAMGFAGLALSSPASFVAARCEAQAERGVALATQANSSGAMYVALLAQLHVLGGPLHSDRARAIAAQLESLSQHNPVELAALPVDLAFYAAARALASGKLKEAHAALERASARSRQLHHAELLWHSERASALLHIASGERAHGHELLQGLHARASQLRLFGTDVFCAYDRVVVLGSLRHDVGCDDGLRRALMYEAEDPPAIWAMKVRALARLELHDEARAALRAVEPSALELLPCDTHYLGTLSHLVHAAVELGEQGYMAALGSLLKRYPDGFASHIFALCDGPVAYLRALLAQASDSDGSSLLFEAALERSERAGLLTCAAEIRRRSSKRSPRGGRAAPGQARMLVQATREPAE